MRRRKVIVTQQQDKALAVDISPLLDVVFILLIFFIVSAVFVRETGVEIERPQATSATQVAERSVLIALTASGEVWHGGAQIGLAGVAPLLRQMPDKPVVIQADKLVEAGILVSLIDACKLASSASVSVASKQG
ncbi:MULTISPECIES: ExbD/TolR family protein [Shewanella]|uniref:Biopolymer transporter ExbD n=1 Tax=Shewanella fidelis TaxID=173509 RepID=A0AAW8NJM4_9GAMM|nr:MULTISPECIES: biopolymer transporter ExbD [Shewanella]MDR8522575.1 biopolymer transporter ExbD [Shewanella fidelis]MDW4812191.1 biopolymer transporter ExbD [Shewanella fidelis]MDW4816145.1 biopolymer transporter ExbD [Shewanella fidelis]MDW4820432.1 biopolymer transporter ExbD [Shewanella fidelis]MDW4824654.1 biopolymer transporter ExbD [Shewanella fidelis]